MRKFEIKLDDVETKLGKFETKLGVAETKLGDVEAMLGDAETKLLQGLAFTGNSRPCSLSALVQDTEEKNMGSEHASYM